MKKEKQQPLWAFTYALSFFTPYEFCSLNCGDYHDPYHSSYVAETVFEMALRGGRGKTRAGFLAEVALLHDADPRDVGTPADVRRTLGWMDAGKAELCSRLGWAEAQFEEAQALIARTDFPYGSEPKSSPDIFDGMSPAEVYDLLLDRLPQCRVAEVMEDAQMLRFADQTASYVRDWNTASLCLDGLVEEFAQIGIETDRYALDTAGFLDALCSDRGLDRMVAWGHAATPEIYTRAELMELLPVEMAEALQRNLMRFRTERYAAA